MTAGVIAQAAGLFAVTNFDDIVVLSLFFAQGAGQRGAARRVVAGQYLAFTAIFAVSLAVAYGASFLPNEALPYLGLLPIGIGFWGGLESVEDPPPRRHRRAARTRAGRPGGAEGRHHYLR